MDKREIESAELGAAVAGGLDLLVAAAQESAERINFIYPGGYIKDKLIELLEDKIVELRQR